MNWIGLDCRFIFLLVIFIALVLVSCISSIFIHQKGTKEVGVTCEMILYIPIHMFAPVKLQKKVENYKLWKIEGKRHQFTCFMRDATSVDFSGKIV